VYCFHRLKITGTNSKTNLTYLDNNEIIKQQKQTKRANWPTVVGWEAVASGEADASGEAEASE
jgi:hypothetical protein